MIREVLCFTIGAAAGFAAASYLLKSRYENMLNEEIESAMEWVKKKTGEDSEEEKKPDGEDKKEEFLSHSDDVKEYNEIRSRMIEDGLIMDKNKPYRISEGDYAVDDEDYGKVTLDFYTLDDSLYEGDEYIQNVEATVGQDNLDFLQSIDDDVLYVRNETYGIDYEIVKVVGRYEDA